MASPMPSVPAPSHHTQLDVVRLFADWTLREIENLFAAHEFTTTAETHAIVEINVQAGAAAHLIAQIGTPA